MPLEPRQFEIKAVGLQDLPAHKELRTLYLYWEEKRGGRDFPSWRDIDLMELYPIAPVLLVKDVIDGGADYYNRFWGSGLTKLTGFDGGHKLHSDLYKDAPGGPVIEPYELVLKTRKPVLVRRNSWFIPNHEHTRCELLHVPVGDASASAITHIVGVCVVVKSASSAIGTDDPEKHEPLSF